MKKRRKVLDVGSVILILFFTRVSSGDRRSNVIVPRTIITKDGPKADFYGKSYIQKFSSSWHIYAKANDIAKREKLKRALKDALYSIENRKKSDISPVIDTTAISRINEAAQLLKEFKQMYSLSENVKRTLNTYNEAKSNLTNLAKSKDGYNMLKRFLVMHSISEKKRNHIPTTKASFIDHLIEDTDNSILKKPLSFEIQKRNLISPYFHHGAAFRHRLSFNPSLRTTTSAFKKARVVLNFMKKKYENNPAKVKVIDHLIEQLDNDMSKASPTLSRNNRKSTLPMLSKDLTPQSLTLNKDDMMESLLNDSDGEKNSEYLTSHTNKMFMPHVVKSYEMKDFPQPANVRTLPTAKFKNLKENVFPLHSQLKPLNRIIELKSVIKPSQKTYPTQRFYQKDRKKQNPFLAALLTKMENKAALRRKEISRQNYSSKKESIFAFTSNNNTNANKTEHVLSHDEQALLSKEIMDTLNAKDSEIINSTKGINNNTENSNSTSNSAATPTSEEYKILQEANTVSVSNDTDAKLFSNLTAPNITDPIKLAMALDKDEKIQDEILKQLSDLQQEKLSEKIAELQKGLARKKNELLAENTTSSDKNSLINPNPHPPGDVSLIQKQQDTMRQLREAKQAREKYEVAKHELAQKVKELYIMANEYEKQETSDQILEVKNFITSSREKGVESYVSSHNVKRDDSHPGIALSGIRNKEPIKLAVADDTMHKSFTMGMTDKKQHAIEYDDDKPADNVKKIYDLPKPLKLEEPSVKTPTKKAKNQEETLKVIAQAIQEDMDEITKNEKKKKILVASLKPKSFPSAFFKKETSSHKTTESSKKKGISPVSKIDEYLTKALAEFMGNDSTLTPFDVGKESKEKENQDEKEERNRKIIENAMRQHAKNPNLPLPLVNTKGDRMELNKDGNDTVNNTYLAINRTDTQKLDKKPIPNNIFAKLSAPSITTVGELDPADKALLDKATHMEEQVAAAQDKLYAADNSPIVDPPVAPQPVVFSPLAKQSSNYEKEAAHNIKTIPIVPFQAVPNDPYETIKEQVKTQDQPAAEHTPSISTAASLPQSHLMMPELPHPLMNDQTVARAQPGTQSPSEDDENDEKEEDDDDDYDDEDDERQPEHHRRHHRYTYRDDYDDESEPDDDEDDDDDEEDDKKSRVRYKNMEAEKRSLQGLTTIKGESASLIPRKKDTPTSPLDDDTQKEELEDSRKRMYIPKNWVKNG